MSALQSDTDTRAGFTLDPGAVPSNGVPKTKSEQSLVSRALALSSCFVSGAASISLSLLLGSPLYLVNEDWYNAWIAFTKQSFGLLTMSLTQAFAPTEVIVSGDASVRGQLLRAPNGNLMLDFPDRLVLIANHQIYTDWLYLWWIAYCNGMHGRLYIILKESLKHVPVLGWGMQFGQFIFLKRNWEQDKPHLAEALSRFNKLTEPMWLLLFPEGTNLAPGTRQKSATWARKNGISDTQHVLLPRSTGLRFCLDELKDSVGYMYDCTIAYSGVPRGQFAQDIYTLRAGYIEGRPPKSVSMYWRRFAIKDIPVQNAKAFEMWLDARWREKDLLMENYLRFGRFPSDVGVSKMSNGQIRRGCGLLKAQIKSSHWFEFLQIFAPMGILAMVLYMFYGGLPQKFWKSVNKKALQSGAEDLKNLKDISPGVRRSLDFNALFDKDRQDETFRKVGSGLVGLLNSQEAKVVLDRTNVVQRWLEDPQKFISDSISPTQPKENFLEALRRESDKRNGIKASRGTFWKDLEALQAIKASQAGANTFDSTSREIARKPVNTASLSNPPAIRGKQPSNPGKGSFWEQLQAEETNRSGSMGIASTTGGTTPTKVVSYPKTETNTISSTIGSSHKNIPKLGPASKTADRASKTNDGKQIKPSGKIPTRKAPDSASGHTALTKNATTVPKTPPKLKST